MKTKQQIQLIINLTKAKIDDLLLQKEENAAKQNWSVVKGIKEQVSPLIQKLKVLEWVLSDEEE
jgi:hypothetical protein